MDIGPTLQAIRDKVARGEFKKEGGVRHELFGDTAPRFPSPQPFDAPELTLWNDPAFHPRD